MNHRAAAANSIPSHYRPGSLKEHLRIIPTDGNINLKLTIMSTSSLALEDAITQLSEAIGSPVSFASVVSIVLFDFVVEENITEVINKLGLNLEDAAAFLKAARRSETNVIPFR